jgi:transcriptional regulator with XRE-family HTH domain
MLDQESIGGRIAMERKLRGLTQRQLAQRANVSYSLLQKVEQGERPATLPLLAAVAAALGLERGALTGQPYRSGDRAQDSIHDLVPAIRQELIAYRLPPQDVTGTVNLPRLRRMVAAISDSRHAVDLADLASRLPVALHALRVAHHVASGPDREQVMALLAETYYAARQLLHKLGYPDLATAVADRYAWAAEQSGDPLAVALGQVFLAGELDAAADWRTATSVMERAVADLHDAPEVATDPATRSVLGFLHLMAGYMTAHAGDSATTWAHYAEAGELAARNGDDRDDYRLAFGPTNWGIWGTALGVELMDGAKAVALAERVHLPEGTPPERAGHHHIDLARGRLLNGDRQGALGALLEARRIASQQTRYHPLVRETLYALAQAERRRSDTLRGMAAWVGLQD